MTAFFVSYPASLLSLAFALYFLYIVGDMVEGVYGRREFFAYYIAAGLVGSLGVMAAYLRVRVIACPSVPVYGIGAPTAAVLVLAACHFPQRRIMLMFVIPVPIWLLAAGIVGLNILGFVGSGGALHSRRHVDRRGVRADRITGDSFGSARSSVASDSRPGRGSPARLRIHPGSAGREVVSDSVGPAESTVPRGRHATNRPRPPTSISKPSSTGCSKKCPEPAGIA